MEVLAADRARAEAGLTPSIIDAIRKSISGREYSCSVNEGVVRFSDESNDGTRYDSDAEQYLPLLTPKLTKRGQVAVHQPLIPKRTTKWWKAQCGFRGLPVGGSLRELQDRIRANGGKGLSDSMSNAREQLKEEYVAKNADAFEKIWGQADPNQKVKMAPKRFLYESFLAHPSSKNKVFVVEVDDWGNAIEKVSGEMHIHCEMKKMPSHSTGQRLVVLGLDRQKVSSRFASIERDAARAAKREITKRKEQEQKARDNFQEQFNLAESEKKGVEEGWYLCGNWEISCPYIEDQWPSDNSSLNLQIRLTKPSKAGELQMYANFDFGVITGIMRFVNPDASKEHDDRERESRKRKRQPNLDFDDEDDLDESEEEAEYHRPTPPHFMFLQSSLPSPSRRSLGFRWRGEETGEGEIQLQSDKQLCSVTFQSPKALSGTFISDLTGTIEFKGVWKGPESSRPVVYWGDPSSAWNARSEAAYERARVGRWG